MALASIGKNYAGNDAKLEADIAAPWYRLWYAKFKEDHPDIQVVVVQAYGFARASAGVHSGGWCVDFQIWHLTTAEIRELIQHLRKWGASATWERDDRDGMEPHIHATIDSEGRDPASDYQTGAVKQGRNGLVNNGRDRYADLNPATWLTAVQAIEQLQKIGADMASAKEIGEYIFHGVDWGGEDFSARTTRMLNTTSQARDAAQDANLRCQDLERSVAGLNGRLQNIESDLAELQRGIYDPDNPYADDAGYVSLHRWLVHLRDEIRAKRG